LSFFTEQKIPSYLISITLKFALDDFAFHLKLPFAFLWEKFLAEAPAKQKMRNLLIVSDNL